VLRSVVDCLRTLLSRLGLPRDDLTDDPVELAGRLRAALKDRKVLLFLDNVVEAAILRQLQVPTPGCLVIAATRGITQPPSWFRPLRVRALRDGDVAVLVDRRFAVSGVTCSTDFRQELISVSGGMPLAVVMSTSMISSFPRGSETLLRAALREGPGDTVERSCSAAYDRMSQPARLTFRLLSRYPGTEVDADGARAMVDLPPGELVMALEELAQKGLIYPVGDAFRYVHDRIRAAAMRRADEAPGEVLAATGRAYRDLLWRAASYERALSDRPRVSPALLAAVPAGAESERKANRRSHLDWLERRHDALMQAARGAAEAADHLTVVGIAEALQSVQHLHDHRHERFTVADLAVNSARALDDPLLQMKMLVMRGTADYHLGRVGTADFEASEQIANRLGHRLGLQSALEWHARAQQWHGNFDQAHDLYDRAFAAAQSIEDAADRDRACAITRFQDGRAWLQEGERRGAATGDPAKLELALERVRFSVEYFQSTSDLDNYARTLLTCGQILLGLGRASEVVPVAEYALRIYIDEDSLRSEAHAGRVLAKAHEALGDLRTALDYLRRAHAIYRQLFRNAEMSDVGGQIERLEQLIS
jgi:tetratricopeptide (TPR) repeat protein